MHIVVIKIKSVHIVVIKFLQQNILYDYILKPLKLNVSTYVFTVFKKKLNVSVTELKLNVSYAIETCFNGCPHRVSEKS